MKRVLLILIMVPVFLVGYAQDEDKKMAMTTGKCKHCLETRLTMVVGAP